jgi:hypothetical protein
VVRKETDRLYKVKKQYVLRVWSKWNCFRLRVQRRAVVNVVVQDRAS